jgi:hypothetical protein
MPASKISAVAPRRTGAAERRSAQDAGVFRGFVESLAGARGKCYSLSSDRFGKRNYTQNQKEAVMIHGLFL